MAVTVSIDLAKTVFELAAADEMGRILERRRVSRRQLEQYFANRSVGKVVMEACGTAHYWGRWCQAPCKTDPLTTPGIDPLL